MLTPQQITELAETLYPALDDLNQWITQDMVKRLMARLGRGEDAILSGVDRWQTEVYQAAGGHLEDLQKELQKFTKQTDAEIASIFEDAAVKAWAADCAVYVANGHDVQPLALSERMVKILQDAYTRTQGEAHNFTRTTASASQKRLFKVLDEARFKVITGAQSYTAAVQEAVDKLVQHQTYVVYPTGHRDTIETAVLRAVRTGISQATGDMTMQGMIDHDWDIIRTSAHLGARYGDGGQNPGNHFWWQGKLYSRTGRTPGLPLFAKTVGFGTGEGLGGYNCRHSFGPGDPNHNPFQTFDEAENRRVYDLTQKQRAKEARIRRDKTAIAGYRAAAKNAADGELRAALENKAAKAEARLQKHTQDYNQFCADNELKPLNDRLYVARRSQAAAPKAARENPLQLAEEPKNNDLNIGSEPVTMQSISNVKSFNCETLDGAKQRQLQNAHKRLLMTAAKQPPGVEVGKAFDLNMKPLTQDVVGSAEGHSVKLPNFNVPYAVIHTHPACGIFSHGDLSSFAKNENLKLMTAIGHNGHIYAVEKSADYDAVAAKDIVWQLNAGIDRLKNIPRAELADEQLLEQAEKLVWQAIKELQENGVRFYE